MSGIIEALNKRVVQHPDRLLYVFLDIKGNVKESYTYAEFDARVKSLASFLQKTYDFPVGDRLILAYPPGLEIICAFFACVRIGWVPVPVYPPSANGFQSSIRKMQFIANDCSASAILSTRAYQLSAQINMDREGGSDYKISKSFERLKWIPSDDVGTLWGVTFEPKYSNTLFLQYTSGSTNDPKGVMVSHDNLIDNCDNAVDHTPIGVSWLPQYHDMGLIGYYLFFALKGGTTYGFSPTDFILKPSLWLETISKYKATATSAPNFAFDFCLQEGKISDEVMAGLDLCSLQYVMNAAEPVKAATYEQFIQKFEPYGLNPPASFAAYGLAENTLAVTNYGRKSKEFSTRDLKIGIAVEVDDDDSEEIATSIMSCGLPLGDTKVKIVNSDHQPIALSDNEIGEIWVSGSSKALGYWNRPELSSQIFGAQLEGDDRLWLRTGDLGFMHDGELYVCGRLKDMIIIRGLNYFPHDIEAIIEEDECVRKGCVAVFASVEEKGEALIAIIGVKNRKRIPDMSAINKKLNDYMGLHIHKALFVLARDIVKTSSGKIRRGENKRLFEQGEFDVIQVFEPDASLVHQEDDLDSPNPEIDRLFRRYGLSSTLTSNLGDAGLDSLKLAEFAHDLKQIVLQLKHVDLAEELDVRIIQKIAASELYEIMAELGSSNRLARFKFKQAIARIQNEFQQFEVSLMKRDANSILENSEALKQLQTSDQEGAVLVTGGTGFFGPFIIKSLLEQQSDDVYVLVRAENHQKGFDRLRKAFEKIECGPEWMDHFDLRVRAIPGDLEKFKFGWGRATWTEMSKQIHTIYHNGARVNYLMDYETMRASNVDGTIEVIRLATSERLKVLNYVSTTFIFGWSTKDVLYETDINEHMELLDFGYSQSKWVSERVVEHAINQGLPGRIFRPALISPSINGSGYNFDIAIRLLAFMVKYRIGTSAKNQVSFTPADIAANNIVAISGLKESLNYTFHVTRDEFSEMQDVTKILSKLTNREFQHFDLKEFVPEVISRCQKEDILFPLLNFLVRSVDNISSMEFKRYDNSNYQRFRKASPWGKEDGPLEEVVSGIYRFMLKNEMITTNTQEIESK